MEKRAIFERSADTQALVDFFTANAQPGVTFSYDQLSEVIGADIRDRRWCLQSAIRAALSELDLVIKAVRGEGVEVLTDHKIPKCGDDARRRQISVARKGLRELGRIRDFGSLEKAEQESVTINRTLLKLTIHTGRQKTIERVRAIAAGQQSIPIAKLCDAIGNRKAK